MVDNVQRNKKLQHIHVLVYLQDNASQTLRNWVKQSAVIIIKLAVQSSGWSMLYPLMDTFFH